MNQHSLWKVLLAALALALAGGAVGALLTLKLVQRARAKNPPPHAAALAHPGRMQQAMEKIHHNLVAELDLNETEAAAVRTELDRTAAELRRARVEAFKNSRTILRESTSRLAETLPPEKREKFRRYIEQRLRRAGLATPAEP